MILFFLLSWKSNPSPLNIMSFENLLTSLERNFAFENIGIITPDAARKRKVTLNKVVIFLFLFLFHRELKFCLKTWTNSWTEVNLSFSFTLSTVMKTIQLMSCWSKNLNFFSWYFNSDLNITFHPTNTFNEKTVIGNVNFGFKTPQLIFCMQAFLFISS